MTVTNTNGAPSYAPPTRPTASAAALEVDETRQGRR